MTFRHFQIFVAVCDKMNMTAAAESLYMSQPAVSQAISELETHYNIKLFERLSRKLYLTHAGNKLLGFARHILRTNLDAEHEMRSLEFNAILRVGVSVTVGSSVLPKLVSAFKLENPQVKIEVIEENTSKIEKLISNDVLDLGIVEGDITISDLISRPLVEDRLVLICGKDHPFASKSSIDPLELEHEEFILREVGSGTRNTFESVMAANGLEWTASWTCNNTDTIKAAVAEGLGISIISNRAVLNEVKYGLLQIVEINGLMFKRQFKLTHHKNKHLTKLMGSFLDFCVDKI